MLWGRVMIYEGTEDSPGKKKKKTTKKTKNIEEEKAGVGLEPVTRLFLLANSPRHMSKGLRKRLILKVIV